MKRKETIIRIIAEEIVKLANCLEITKVEVETNLGTKFEISIDDAKNYYIGQEIEVEIK